MTRDSDKHKNMSKKNKQDFSDSENESEYDYVEATVLENPDVSAKEINKMILDIFPLKSKKEKLKQLKKIRDFKKQEKKGKMKHKSTTPGVSTRQSNRKHRRRNPKLKTHKDVSEEEEDEDEEEDEEEDDEEENIKLKRSFEQLKLNKSKRLLSRPLTKDQLLGKSTKKRRKENKHKKVVNKKVVTKKVAKKNDKQKRNRKRSKDIEQEWETVEETESSTEEETMEEDDSDYFPENEDDVLDNDELDMLKDGNMKFNIIFTTGGPNGGRPLMDFDDYGAEYDDFMKDEYDEYDEEYDDVDEYVTSDDNDTECSDSENETSSKSSKHNMSKKKKSNKTKFTVNEVVNVKLKDWVGFYKGTVVKVHSNKNKTTKKIEVTYDIELDDDNGEEYDIVTEVPSTRMKKINKETIEFENLIREMRELSSIKKKGKKAYQKKIDQMVKASEKQRQKHDKKEKKRKKKKYMSKFKSLLKTKDPMNEFKYFNGLAIEQQKLILKKMKDLNEFDNVEKPYRLQLIESDIPVEYKSCAIKKINSLTYMDPGSGEYYKIKQWVDTFMKLPFNKYNNLPITMADGPEKCKTFMEDAKASLDNAVYGLDDAKMQIMQIVGQWISNPDSVGNAIAIQGPMGTGKTTLVKNGISKILNRPFAFLALGGATDSSFLEGHSYTYEGSSWGKIVDILLTSKCMNPVIYFDELDKISNTPKGEEIAGILTHLTDLTQNSQYHDKYFSNLDFNLSKALFIFSYNDESKVNKILLDRMYKIKTKGYDTKQKITIANDYLIPSIIKNVNFQKDDIVFPIKTLEYIINENTEGEKGVRNLKRALEIIYTKLNLYRLMKEDTTLFENQTTFKVTFPHTVTIENVKVFIKKNDSNTQPPFGMYV